MSAANERTIATYNANIQAYIDGTHQQVSGNQKKWLDLAFSDIGNDAAILEIGSAFGRDARYLMELGYTPKLTDGTPAFVEYLAEHGFDVELLDIVRQQPPGTYDAILASAVFLHFTDDDFENAIAHVREALNHDGKFIFSLKQGEGEIWSTKKMGNDRYFNYWTRESITSRLGSLGLSLVDAQTFEDDIWLYLTSRKA